LELARGDVDADGEKRGRGIDDWIPRAVPRLKCTFREFIAIIEALEFKHHRQDGSHRQYRGVVDGQTRYVTIAYHNINDEILPDTLVSMIRQSGLPKKLFRK